MYAAVLVRDDPTERMAVQQDFKRLYNLRSKAVMALECQTTCWMGPFIDSWACFV